MNKEDYVSYDLALALKECGSDEPCRKYYTNDYVNTDPEDLSRKVRLHNNRTSTYNHNRVVGCTSAPTLWHAQKWLRNIHNIDINICLADETDNPYTVEIYRNKKYIVGHWRLGFFTTYEEALAAGIAKALERVMAMQRIAHKPHL